MLMKLTSRSDFVKESAVKASDCDKKVVIDSDCLELQWQPHYNQSN